MNYAENPDKLTMDKKTEKDGKKEKKIPTKMQKTIGIVSGIALLAAGIANPVINHFNQAEKSPEPPENPTEITETQSTYETADNNSNEVADATSEILPTVENIEIDASLLSNPEELTRIYVDERTTSWFNAGATIKNAKEAYESRNIDKYATKIAAEYDLIFEEALLTEDWKSNPEIAEWVTIMEKVHLSTLYFYYLTYNIENDPLDKVGYARGSKLNEIIQPCINNSDGSVSVTSTENDYDNQEENRVGESLSNNKSVDGNVGTVTRAFINENGKAKLSDIKLDRSNYY